MTTKEIGVATGKNERTIRRWIALASDKMSVVAAKMSDSTSAHPADFTIDEVLGIIEAGAGKEAAGIFRANAGKTNESADGNGLAHLGAMVANLAVTAEPDHRHTEPAQPAQPAETARLHPGLFRRHRLREHEGPQADDHRSATARQNGARRQCREGPRNPHHAG